MCSQSYHTGKKLFEGSCRVRAVAAPREEAGAGLGQHRQVDAKESVSKMCGTEQGQIQLQKVPGQEGQDGSASEQAKGLRWGSSKQKETKEKWKRSGKQGRQKGATETRQAVTERLLTDSLPLEQHPGWVHGQNLSA